jgi:hypothetical protein
MPDSVRHLQKFEDSMKRYLGDIDRAVYSAEILCTQTPEGRRRIGRCDCPFVPDHEPHICPLVKLRELIGDHVKQDPIGVHTK